MSALPVPVPVPVPESGAVPEPGKTAPRPPLELVPKKPGGNFDVEAAFEVLYARHPQSQRRDRGIAKTYYVQSLISGVDPVKIDQIHAQMCETEGWQWKSGAKAPTLAQWLLDHGWQYPPEPRSRDSPNRHRDEPPAAFRSQSGDWVLASEVAKELEGEA